MSVGEPLYPVNLRLAGRRCLVVGGGRVAANKIAGLLEADAVVTVVAPVICAEVLALGDAISLHERPYRPGDLIGATVAILATGDADLNAAIHADAIMANVLVNSADDPEHCDFTLPARVRRGDLLLTASTGGRSPAISKWLRGQIAEEFGPEYELLLDVFADARDAMRKSGIATEVSGWQDALDSGMLELIREGRIVEAKERLQACLSLSLE